MTEPIEVYAVFLSKEQHERLKNDDRFKDCREASDGSMYKKYIKPVKFTHEELGRMFPSEENGWERIL